MSQETCSVRIRTSLNPQPFQMLRRNSYKSVRFVQNSGNVVKTILFYHRTELFYVKNKNCILHSYVIFLTLKTDYSICVPGPATALNSVFPSSLLPIFILKR